MIDVVEIQNILNSEISEMVVCKEFEFRPAYIAEHVKKIANMVDSYGFILIGVIESNGRYEVKGLSSNYCISEIVNKALDSLTVRPHVESEQVVIMRKTIYVIKVWKANGGTSIKSDRIHSKAITTFINDLYSICIKLQGNSKYINASEDERNDYIRDMLESKGYVVNDQTRRGVSSTGKNSGEVDLFIKRDNEPFTVIEALNLSSLHKSYLGEHLNKIYSYDTIGNAFNVCVSYVKVADFAGFWENYCKFVKEYKYPFPMIDFNEKIDDEYLGSEIKIMTTTHNRSGQYTLLYHICIKIMSVQSSTT